MGPGRREGRPCYSYPRPSPAGRGRQDTGWVAPTQRATLPTAAKARRAWPPGCPPNPAPKISPNRPAGSRSQHRHGPSSLWGAAAASPSPSWLRFSPLPSQPVIHAHSSSGPPRKAPKEAQLTDTSVRAARLPAARRASQHLRRGLPATLFCLPAPAPARSFHPPRKEAFAKRPCQPEAPRRAKRWQEGFDSRWS